MPNYVSLNGRFFILSDDPAKASTEATAVAAVGLAASDSKVFTTIDNTDTSVPAIILNP